MYLSQAYPAFIQGLVRFQVTFPLQQQASILKAGKIASAVKQMTIAGNFFDYLKDIEEVGADLKFMPGGYGSPSLVVKELSVTVD